MSSHLLTAQKGNLKFVLVIGLSCFLLMLIDYYAFRNSGQPVGYVEGNGALLILIVGIVLSIRHRRNTDPNSELTFWQGLSTGIIIAFWSGLVYSISSYLYIFLINPHYVDEMLLNETYRLPHNVTAAESVGARFIAEITFKPIYQLVGKFLGSLFFGVIISAICSVLFRRK